MFELLRIRVDLVSAIVERFPWCSSLGPRHWLQHSYGCFCYGSAEAVHDFYRCQGVDYDPGAEEDDPGYSKGEQTSKVLTLYDTIA